MWGAKAIPKDDISLFPKPFEQRRHVDLIGFVIPGHSIDHDVDPKANRHLTLLFAARYDCGERVAAFIAGPARRPIITPHDNRGPPLTPPPPTPRRCRIFWVSRR